MSALPAGWEMKTTPDGKTYYVDHNTRQTHWTLPADFQMQAQAPVIPQTPMMQMPAQVQHVPQPAPVARQPSHTAGHSGGSSVICTQELMRRANEEESVPAEKFSLQSPYMLEVQLDGRVFCKKGAMTAYRGKIKFEKGSGGSIGNKLLKMATGEGPSMMKATGKGRLYVSDYKKNITILKLTDEAIIVNGNDLLCWDDGMEWKVTMMKGASGMLSGGLFNVKIKGTGHVCFTTHGNPLVLVASKDKPLVTDPQATVAWSGHLDPSLKTDVSIKSFIGKGSGEELSMQFNGSKEGFVIVQPFEEMYQAA